MHKHTCIKPECSNTYEDKDPDAYYCPSCKEAKMELAKKVDAMIASRPKRKTTSALQEYDNAQKVHGFVQTRL